MTCGAFKSNNCGEQDALTACNFGNIRYQYVTLPPRASGLSLNLESLSSNPVVWYSDEVRLKIQKKGCGSECGPELCYSVDTINMDQGTVSFIFDDRFKVLCAGRYEVIVCIGCTELPCRLDFCVGQKLCVTDVSFTNNVDVDARTETDPNCCDDGCAPKSPKCDDIFNSTGGDSLKCPNELQVNYNMSDKEMQEMEDWINSGDTYCNPAATTPGE